MAFEKMKKSIPMIAAFIIILIHVIISAYLLSGGTLDVSYLSFLGSLNRVWFISLMLCMCAAILLVYA